MTNSKNYGFAHAKEILTNKNMTELGITLTRALSDDDYKAIAEESTYQSIEALQNKINSLPANLYYKESVVIGGGGGGGGGRSSVGSGRGSIKSIGNIGYVGNNSTSTSETGTDRKSNRFSDLDGYLFDYFFKQVL